MSVLGPEWDVNMGKVDWLHYSPGKVSKECVPQNGADITSLLTSVQVPRSLRVLVARISI